MIQWGLERTREPERFLAALNKPLDAKKSTARELADEASSNASFLAAMGVKAPIKADAAASE